MAETALNDVFISYAEEDQNIALRLDADLTRAKLSVWRYQSKGRIGDRFPEELKRIIENSRYFCILDSAAARQSTWVPKECEIAMRSAQERSRPAVIPCRIQPPQEGTLGKELFRGHEVTRYIDLTHFEEGMPELCERLGTTYAPQFYLLRDKDFVDEAFASQLRLRQVSEIIERYSWFRLWMSKANTKAAENEISALINVCEALGAHTIVSPQIARGILFGECQRHDDARLCFKVLVQSHSDDPRAWAGLAGAQYYCADYAAAVSSYRRSIELLGSSTGEFDVGLVTQLRHNLARALLAMGKPNAAWSELATLPQAELQRPFVQALRGHIRLQQGRPHDALPLLEGALSGYCESDLPASLLVDLADCYSLLGNYTREAEVVTLATSRLSDNPELWRRKAQYCVEVKDSKGAIVALKQATRLAPTSPVYQGELSLVLLRAGQTKGAQAAAAGCVRLRPVTPRDHYYRGLAYHILGKGELAEQEYSESRRDAIIRKWAPYAELTTAQSD